MSNNSLMPFKDILELACVKYNAVVVTIKDEKMTITNPQPINKIMKVTKVFYFPQRRFIHYMVIFKAISVETIFLA